MIKWNDIDLKHCDHPQVPWILLGSKPNVQTHCEQTKAKVSARNNIPRKLVGSKWKADPYTLRTAILALCFLAGEYACPVWSKSAHEKKVDIPLNEVTRLITEWLRPIPIPKLYTMSGIAPPHIRREVHTRNERTKQLMDERHLMNGQIAPHKRLKSRKVSLEHVNR